MLIKIRLLRVVSPPASTQLSRPDAPRNPFRKLFSHFPVALEGSARFNKKQRGVPPIAAISLAALARHFQPTLSAGCFSRRKCEPSRNQSLVRISANPDLCFHNAASSPIPTRSLWPWLGRNCRAISPTSASSSRKCFIFSSYPNLPCPYGQWTVSEALYQNKENTGLTRQPTETNMQRVANQGSRFRLFEVAVSACGNRE